MWTLNGPGRACRTFAAIEQRRSATKAGEVRQEPGRARRQTPLMCAHGASFRGAATRRRRKISCWWRCEDGHASPKYHASQGRTWHFPSALAHPFSVWFETLFSRHRRNHRKRVRETHSSVALPHLDRLSERAMNWL